MARRRVAMEIKAAGGFEDSMQFHQTRSHHGQIRHHRGISEEIMQRLHHFHDGGVRAVVQEFGEGLGGVGPIPGVGEGVELSLAGLARSLAEQDVVIRIGIERRVEINEVHAGVGKNPRVPQPLEIIAKKEAVHAQVLYHAPLPGASTKTHPMPVDSKNGFPAAGGSAKNGASLDIADVAGETDQNRGQSRAPFPADRLPDGGSGGSARVVPGDSGRDWAAAIGRRGIRMKVDHGKNTSQQRRRCLHLREKRGIGARNGIETPSTPQKNRGEPGKKACNPGGLKIITKTAKNSSFTQ